MSSAMELFQAGIPSDFTTLTSDDFFQKRADWLTGILNEPGVDLAGNLLMAADDLFERQYKPWDDGDFETRDYYSDLSKQISNAVDELYYDEALEFRRAKGALENLQDRRILNFWGDETKLVIDGLLSYSTPVQSAVPERSFESSVYGYVRSPEVLSDILQEKIFVSPDTLYGAIDKTVGEVVLSIGTGDPIQLPLSNVVSADGFTNSWLGRGIAGEGSKEIALYGEEVRSTSWDTIVDYAARPIQRPAIDYANVYIQPDNKVLVQVTNGNHSTAAALAMGGQSVAITDKVFVNRLGINLV